jgi:D-lactate dehydrogenase (cytochrome)
MTATVEAGVILGDLQKAVDAKAFFIRQTRPNGVPDRRQHRNECIRVEVVQIRSDAAVCSVVERCPVERRAGLFAAWRDDRGSDGKIVLTTRSGGAIEVHAPSYKLPAVRKNTSGYFSGQNMDAVDLFIGSEGTLGVVVEAELDLIARPEGFFSGSRSLRTRATFLAFVDGGEDRQRVADRYFDQNSLGFYF